MRPRTRNKHLPRCVYQKHGAYWYVKGGKWTRLGGDLHEALAAYAKILAPPGKGLPGMIDDAMPHVLKDVAPSTAAQYRSAAEMLKVTFKDFQPDQLTHGKIVEMMDAFADVKGVANRLLTVLRKAYGWALNRERVLIDPTARVKRFKQNARERLITDAEFDAIKAHAPDWLQVVMDLCFLTGQRIGDVLLIERQHITEDGIYFRQQKTGKHLIVGMTPELEAVIRRAKEIDRGAKSARYLLSSRGGAPRIHSNVWFAFKRSAKAAGVTDVTLHDLRALAGTEAERQGVDPTALLGHSDRRTTQSYLRDKRARVVAGPKMKRASKG